MREGPASCWIAAKSTASMVAPATGAGSELRRHCGSASCGGATAAATHAPPPRGRLARVRLVAAIHGVRAVTPSCLQWGGGVAPSRALEPGGGGGGGGVGGGGGRRGTPPVAGPRDPQSVMAEAAGPPPASRLAATRACRLAPTPACASPSPPSPPPVTHRGVADGLTGQEWGEGGGLWWACAGRHPNCCAGSSPPCLGCSRVGTGRMTILPRPWRSAVVAVGCGRVCVGDACIELRGSVSVCCSGWSREAGVGASMECE